MRTDILEVWRRPRDYAGFSPDGDYLIASVHRDSDTISRSNWAVLCADLGAEFYASRECTDERPPCYAWRAAHWAVGWIEYLCVRADAPGDLIARAIEWMAALEDYPVADDGHLTDLEYTEACDFWERMRVRERAEYCARAGVSIFAARRDELPDDPTGALLQSLNGY